MALIAALLAVGCGSSQAGSGTRNATLDPAALIGVCVTTHHMNGPSETLSTLGSSPVKAITTSRHCEQPPPSYAAQDGFSEIVVTGYLWDGRPESSGASNPEVVRSPCAEIELVYTFQKQGPPSSATVRAAAGATVDIFGTPWPPTGQSDVVPFPHGSTDAIVVHNLSYSLNSARCVR